MNDPQASHADYPDPEPAPDAAGPVFNGEDIRAHPWFNLDTAGAR